MNPIDALKAQLGADKVDCSPATLAAAAADCWPVTVKRAALGRQTHPLAVARPSSTEEVGAVLAWARSHRIPVAVRGAGSAVTGAATAGDGELVLDMSHLDLIVSVDEDDLTVTVGAGVLGGVLEQRLAAHGYTTGFSPQSLHRSTVGGWVSTRASGQLSSRYGSIEDAVVGLEVVLPNGRVVSWRPLPRWSAGPDLRQLFVGAEGTLGVVTQVTLRTHRVPEATRLQSFRFRSLSLGLDAVRGIAQSPLRPAIVRLYDPSEAARLTCTDPSDALLLLSFEGLRRVAEAELDEASRICRSFGGEAQGTEPVRAWLDGRYDFRAVEEVLASPGGVAETIEVSTPWSRAEGVHAAMTTALADVAETIWGHFSHVYPQGTSLYVIALAQCRDDEHALMALETIWRRAIDASRTAGGSIVHHHGIGLARLPWLADELGAAHGLLRDVKTMLDPGRVLAPGRLGC